MILVKMSLFCLAIVREDDSRFTPEKMADVLRAIGRLCFLVCLFALFVTYARTYFVHNVAATVSCDRK
jgi:hypothetical protein